MKGIAKKLIIVSFILSIMATASVYYYLNSLKNNKKEEMVNIIAAQVSIPKGTVIQKDMLKEVEISKDALLDSFITDYSHIVGKFAKENIVKDEIIIKEKLQSENINELSFQIDENKRAVSMNVTGDTGVSYLIKPGDYVDVIVFLQEKREANKLIRPEIAKMILQNVKVLAVDRNLSRENSPKDDGKVPTNFFVTLEVPANDVEKLVLAGDIGVVKLALRSVKDDKIINTNGTIDSDLLKGSSGTSSTNTKTKYIYYKVKKGDTLRNISRAFYGVPDNYALLKEINKIKDENIIVPGMVIKIPVAFE
ncbi:LysM domain/BON superfamily protein [Caloramator mitchellensis]|uniref:LysM domain/BON superfamily protein n=1 Tax=Caloramator mitchellensis TaxID=908809 RepID=A0A0R3JS28_CALMK|nr:Flp pilus assembly protein CpaB [Caloramator mitchellensis]KRQ86264.1 LysM domain/BON superfamily protein [Caloramator mitchellensis]